ncbi:hypothetical protein ACQUW5_07445 [Legionella sp. CNM-1927-20]|uniref:hypothetical protein n=1 Tax=Legionella sp. CNM-1927-20 TaxID=3422221 RepID=UPI00403AF5F1
MKVNSLYGTLTHKLTQVPNFKLKNEIVPIKAITLDSKNYYRLALPSNQLELTEGWLPAEVHLSIYEEFDPKNPVLGPSHFTAIWHNGEGEAYRLHIFLNDNDILACQPYWDYIEESGQFSRAELPAEIESLVQVTLQLGLPYMQQLRQEQALIIQSLEEECSKHEQALQQTSLHLPQSQELYLEQVAKIIPVLSDLYQVTGHIKWSRLQNYFNKFSEALVNQPSASTTISNDTSESLKEPTVTQTGLTQHSLFNSPKAKKHKDMTAPQFLFNEIRSLHEVFHQYKEDKDKITSIESIIEKIYLFDFNNWNLSFREMEKLKKIETEIEKAAYSLLQKALITNDFEKARSLHTFYYLLNSNIYAFSLKQNNHQLLNFLINELHIPINNYKFTINEISYSNALIYCLQKHTKNNNLIDCFAELIKGGGNLMQPIAPNKAPLAYILLSTRPTHPLYPALEKTADLTIENQAFYQRLITAMKTYRNQVTNLKELNDIDEAIFNYQQRLSSINLTKQFFTDQSRTALKELSKTAAICTSPSFVTQLQTDRDIVNSERALNLRWQNLLKKIKQAKHSRLNMPLNSLLQANLKEIQQTLLDIGQINCSFEELKKAALNNYRLLFNLCDELDTLVDISHELSAKPMVVGKKNKQTNKLLKMKEEVESRIRDINKQLPSNVLKELNLSGIFTDLKDIAQKLKNLENELTLTSQKLAELGLFNSDKVNAILEDCRKKFGLDSLDLGKLEDENDPNSCHTM